LPRAFKCAAMRESSAQRVSGRLTFVSPRRGGDQNRAQSTNVPVGIEGW
jgi:hypothetical protein